MGLDTGHGTTIAFTGFSGNPPGFSVAPIAVSIGEMVREKLKTSTLATTFFHTYVPGDLVEPPEIEVRYYFDSTVDDQPFTHATPANALIFDPIPGTLTITLPEQVAAGNPPTFAGTGFLVMAKFPDMETDVVQEAMIRFAFDGETGPTWTKDAAA